MKREILFKAKRVDNAEWVEGDLIEFKGKYQIIQHHHDGKWRLVRNDVIPKTVCQFTGLTDKNGKKIFEGDILRGPDRECFRIYAVPGGFAMKAKAWSKDLNDLILTDDLIMEPIAEPQTRQWIEQNCEVVKSIHDCLTACESN